MFYRKGNYCYASPTAQDGDFIEVAGRWFEIEYSSFGEPYITNNGQTHLLAE